MDRYLLVILVLFYLACNKWQKELECRGDKEQIIKNVVIDFVNTSDLVEKYDVFYLVYYDVDTQRFRVDILPLTYKLYITNFDTLGKPTVLFTEYYEYEGKLFLYRGKDRTLRREIIDKMWEYDVLDSLELEVYLPPVRLYCIDYSLPAVSYLVCKCDYCRYLRRECESLGKVKLRADKLRCKCF